MRQLAGYQPPGAPVPVVTPGAPPAVDVDDGRGGQYGYQRRFWENTSVWNRLAPHGHAHHQAPRPGVPNYAYVRVSNRAPRTPPTWWCADATADEIASELQEALKG